MIDVKIINIYYYNNYCENDDYNFPVLCLGCRDRKNKKYLVQICDKKLAPNFRVLKEEWEKLESDAFCERWNIIGSDKAPDSLYGEKVVELYTRYPWEVRNVREEKIFSQTFQADVKWKKMALSKIVKYLDLDGPYLRIPDDYAYMMVKLDDMKKLPKEEFFLVKYRICYYDIESDSRKIPYKMKYQDLKKMPIVSITVYDNYEGVYYQFVWHPDFKQDMVREFENREIIDNVSGNTLIIKNIIRHEVTTEKEMLCRFFEYFGSKNYDFIFSYFGEGGYKKIGKSRRWINGFDTPAIYARASEFGLLREIQKMSSCPKLKKRWGGYEGVYLRTGRNDKYEVVIKGVVQLDYVFTDSVLNLARKHTDFRGGSLGEWMAYFLDYHKLDKKGLQVWHYWLQEDLNDKQN